MSWSSKLSLIMILSLLLLTSIQAYVISAQQIVELKTDKPEYAPSEYVTITGKTSGIPDGTQVTIEVRDPVGAIEHVDQVPVSNNQFSTGFRLSPQARLGKHTVYVKIAAYNLEKTTTFYVKQPTSISISLSAISIGLGESVVISGAISPAVADAPVEIWYRKEGGAWAKLVEVRTDTQGRYSYTWTPPEVGTYYLKARWPGDETHFGAESDVVMLSVGKKVSSLTLTVTPEVAKLGEVVTITGRLTPAMVTDITLTIEAPDGTVNTVTVTTEADGTFSYSFTPDKLGRWYVKAEWPGTAEWTPVSAEAYFWVKAETRLTIALSETSVILGSEVIITGELTPPIEGAPITIQYRLPGGTWITLATVTTNAQGKFSYTYVATMAGIIEFRATWPGTDEYFGAESNVVRLTVVSFVKTKLYLYVTPPQITLGEEVTISGYIEPALEGIEITISYKLGAEAWKVLAKVRTDSEGKFSYTWKPDEVGTYVIMATWPGTEVYTEAMAVDVLVVRAPRYSLRVTAVDSHNTPLVGATVRIMGPVTVERTTDSSGSVSVGDLPMGNYRVEVVWHGIVVYSESITLTKNIELRAVCDVYYVTIKVVRDNAPVPNVKVRLPLPDGAVLEGTTGTDGTVTFKQVPRGTYTVLAESIGKVIDVRADTTETIVLPPKPIHKMIPISEGVVIGILLIVIILLLKKLRETA
ncbi:MAG: hypothetical protein DRJ66_06990 [Thermoprotei archaeon]|nr:MAG: hypothetical protein DRJ66_06990 [Thermoprotei archaeon]RLF19008.1 MAG: hypothetical protein DRZ82_07110 [Thermoprotei archaeon]